MSARRVATTAALTVGALVAFAANSILCRMALGTGAIDAGSFTAIRLLSGAIMLLAMTRVIRPASGRRKRSWTSATALFLYALTFSFAYLTLSAGTGALVLFASVQVTMILAGLWIGERPPILEWAGFAVAVAGLIYLVLPGLAAPSPVGAMLMAVSGVSWGVYSLRGRREGDPLLTTTASFVYSVPLVIVAVIMLMPGIEITARGAALAALSGAVTSGLGYVVWYAALQGLTATRAAAVQLSVPVIAAVGGVIFLSEMVSLRLFVSATAILGGVGLAVWSRPRRARGTAPSS
jgi:drug/metabolite transporter (DMT)-like permease